MAHNPRILGRDTLAMPKTLRITLIWLLMLALPAQGMASLAMQACKQNTGGVVLDRDTAQHHPERLVAGSLGQASAHAGHAGMVHQQAAQPADNSQCSLCDFCVGAVTLSSVVVSQSPLQGGEPSLVRRDRFVGFVADTLLRPPRPLLA